MKHVISMKLVKETKNTFRYEAAAPVGQPKPPVDCIYLQKANMEGGLVPQQVTVTVES